LNPRFKLYLFILVNASIPLWTLYFASRFPLHLKVVIAIVSAIFMNLTLYFAMRHREKELELAKRKEQSGGGTEQS